ncbi:unnamed protein product [Ectocarpus sp. 12 AP-2014]
MPLSTIVLSIVRENIGSSSHRSSRGLQRSPENRLNPPRTGSLQQHKHKRGAVTLATSYDISVVVVTEFNLHRRCRRSTRSVMKSTPFRTQGSHSRSKIVHHHYSESCCTLLLNPMQRRQGDETA